MDENAIVSTVVISTVKMGLKAHKEHHAPVNVLIDAMSDTIMEMSALLGVELIPEFKEGVRNGAANGLFVVDQEKNHYDNTFEKEVEIICTFIIDELERIAKGL